MLIRLWILLVVTLPALVPIPTPSEAAVSEYAEAMSRQSQDLLVQVNDLGTHRIAVADFTNAGDQITPLGRFLAEAFTVALLRAGTVQQVDRIEASHTAASLAAIDAVATASIIDLGNRIRITTRLLSPDGNILAAAPPATLLKDGAIAAFFTSPLSDTQRRARHSFLYDVACGIFQWKWCRLSGTPARIAMEP